MGLYKILKYLAVAVAIIGVIFALMVVTGSENMIDNMLYVAYAALVIILILVLIFVLKGLLAGNIKKTLVSLGLFFGIVIVSYFMSSGTDLDLQPFLDKGENITEETSRNVGAGLYTFYALAIFAIGTMAFSGIKKMIK